MSYFCIQGDVGIRGVDNLASGRYTEMTGFRRPTQILPCTFSKRLCRYARTWSQRISQKYVS